MTDCGCEKARAELEEFLHRELPAEDHQDVADHLAGCTDCAEEHVIGLKLMVRVREACKETAPEELRAVVRAMLTKA